MALINTNPIGIAGTELTQDSTFIIGTYFSGKVPDATKAQLTVQIFVYKDAASWLSNPDKNSIKIPELYKNNSFSFDYVRGVDGDIFEYIDIKMKEKLLEIFPTWDANLITFTPPHA